MKKNKPLIYALLILLVIMTLTQFSVLAADESKEKQQPLVTMTLFEMDLREALKEISLQTGVNIIPDQTVSGVVTADLQQVPLKKALRRILISGGYTYRKIEDFYIVGLPNPKSNTFRKLSEVEVMRLKYMNPREVISLLPSFLKQYVTGNSTSDILTINAPPKELTRIRNLISKLDQPRQQIKVKVVVTEVNSKEVKELGNQFWDYVKGKDSKQSINYNLEDGQFLLQTDYYGKLITQLKALEEDHKAKIKANPQILVSDGKTANLFVGEEENVVVMSDSEDTDSRVEEIKVGMKLEVTADVIGKDEVNLQVSPELSHFVDEMRPDIVVKESSLSTTLHLKDRQTAVLAGMTIQNEGSYNKGVPILNKLPLVRWLFSSKTEQKSSRELLIFVTPVIQ